MEVSHSADVLFDAPSHSVEDWAYRNTAQNMPAGQDADIFMATEVPIPKVPPQALEATGRPETVPPTRKTNGFKAKKGERRRIKSSGSSRLVKAVREAWRPAPALSPKRKSLKTKSRRASFKQPSSTTSRNRSVPTARNIGKNHARVKKNLGRREGSGKKKKSRGARTGKKVRAKVKTRFAKADRSMPESATALSPARYDPPTVSRLNTSSISKGSKAKQVKSSRDNSLNRSTQSARSVGSARSTRSLGLAWTASGRLATPKKSRESKTLRSLRLRLSGAHGTIRALQEQLHERTAEVEELRAQLLSKTRALEATRSFANVSVNGSMNASFVARANSSSSGLEAQTRRKYEAKMKEVERECDDAVVDAHRQLQRSVEINSALRKEVARLRDRIGTSEKRVEELQHVLDQTKKSLVQEKKFAAGVIIAGAEDGIGKASMKSRLSINMDDLSGPDVTMRMLRLEVKRLRTLLAKEKHSHDDGEDKNSKVSKADQRRIDKENVILQNRTTRMASSLASRVGLSLRKRSPNNKSALNLQIGNLGESRNHGKDKSVGNARIPSSSSSSQSARRPLDAVRFEKLKKMYDRAHASSVR